MIEIFLLLLCISGSLSAPGRTVILDDKEAEVIQSSLPGTKNLSEMSMPIARLVPSWAEETNQGNDLLPGVKNLAERNQLPREIWNVLPGTNNLAEKSLPLDYVRRQTAGEGFSRNVQTSD